LLLKFLFVVQYRVLHCSLAFILAQICPSRFNARYRSLINCFSVSLAQFKEHLTSDITVVQDFRLDSLENALAKIIHLVDELWSQSIIMQILKSLQISFLFCWSNHSIAISVFEKVKDQPSNPILFFNVI